MFAPIEVDQLTRRFGEIEAVQGISLNVSPGELFALLGPNGAGKTTTIQVMTTLLPPTSGTVRIVGFDVQTQAAQVRSHIGLVFQETSLDINLTAEENLRFHARLYRVDAQLSSERINHLLDVVELSGRRTDLVKNFSGGMKRRLEIARALVHAPAVLFLDEPTTGLDPQTRAKVWDYVHELRSEGTTVLMTTHYIDEAEQCDRVAIMDQGKIIACDSPQALKARTGGEVLTLRSANPQQLASDMKSHLGLSGKRHDQGVILEHQHATQLLPQLIGTLSAQIEGVELRQPTLEDVFLQLTGRNLRSEET